MKRLVATLNNIDLLHVTSTCYQYMLPVPFFLIILGYLNGASILYHVTNICSFWSFRGSHWLRTRHLETAHLSQEHGVTDAGRNAAAWAKLGWVVGRCGNVDHVFSIHLFDNDMLFIWYAGSSNSYPLVIFVAVCDGIDGLWSSLL